MMEAILHERAWLVAAGGGDGAGAAGILILEQLRTLRISIYGLQSRQVEQVNREIAEARAR